MNFRVEDYWNLKKPVIPYMIEDWEWKLLEFQDFFRTRSNELISLDIKKRNEDREKLSYFEFLDKYTIWFKSIIKWLSNKEKKLFDIIFHVFFEKWIKDRINFEKRKSLVFFEELKNIVDNISFEWVNQTDIAELTGSEQKGFPHYFRKLEEKWAIISLWKSWKKKLYWIPPDLLAFTTMINTV